MIILEYRMHDTTTPHLVIANIQISRKKRETEWQFGRSCFNYRKAVTSNGITIIRYECSACVLQEQWQEQRNKLKSVYFNPLTLTLWVKCIITNDLTNSNNSYDEFSHSPTGGHTLIPAELEFCAHNVA